MACGMRHCSACRSGKIKIRRLVGGFFVPGGFALAATIRGAMFRFLLLPIIAVLALCAPCAQGGAAAAQVDIRVVAPDGAALALRDLPLRLPDPARLRFAVQGQASGFHYSASAELLWQHGGGQYRMEQSVKLPLLGTRRHSSNGRVTALGLAPHRFDEHRNKPRWAELDFAQGLARFGSGAPAAPIAPGAQDRLSVFLQLAVLLHGAPHRYPPGTKIHLNTVGAQRAARWTFVVAEAGQRLQLPAGSMQALRLERVPEAGEGKGDGQQGALWLAPALQYLPVRIRLVQDNGDSADMRLKEMPQKLAP